MTHLQTHYVENYPDAGFSVAWNQIECMAHVINLGAKEMLKNYKQPIDSDYYEPGSDSSDRMVTAVSRLSYLVRKIRLSPKLRRLMKKVCGEKGVPVEDSNGSEEYPKGYRGNMGTNPRG
jgi:hypothetical protein